MTREQWDKLSEFITSEAAYAAREVMNRNDCGDSFRRDEIMRNAMTALVGDYPS